MSTSIHPEKLAYWYFRLNGFLTIVNFVLHNPGGGPQRTDVDILGVRFPYREELPENPMRDDKLFRVVGNKPYVAICEVKTGTCNLNGPWTMPERANMSLLMAALGVFARKDWPKISCDLYKNGLYENCGYRVSLICVGQRKNAELSRKYPDVPQLTWRHIKCFIYRRFKTYQRPKAHHPQWDADGEALWKCFLKSETVSDFLESVAVEVPAVPISAME